MSCAREEFPVHASDLLQDPGPAINIELEDADRTAQPVERFDADTSWTDTASFLEIPAVDVIVSTSTEACGYLEDSECDRDQAPPGPSTRTATLLAPDVPPDAGRSRVFEDEVWPRTRSHEPGVKSMPPRPKAGSDLPSAKDILAAVSIRSPAPSGKPLYRTSEDQVKPTEFREPDQWFPHLWLVWPPTALLVIGLGIMGSLLSLRWSSDSFNASVVSQRLLARTENPGKQKALPESVVPPETSWWRTTPLHLVEWGVYLGKQKTDGDRTEEARELIMAAARISPINPTARLNRAQLATKSKQTSKRGA